jgi:hypothetical protein
MLHYCQEYFASTPVVESYMASSNWFSKDYASYKAALVYQPEVAARILETYRNKVLNLENSPANKYNPSLIFHDTYKLKISPYIMNNLTPNEDALKVEKLFSEIQAPQSGGGVLSISNPFFYHNTALGTKRYVNVTINANKNTLNNGVKLIGNGEVIVFPKDMRNMLFSDAVKNGIDAHLIVEINYSPVSCSPTGEVSGVTKELYIYSTKYDPIHLRMFSKNDTVNNGIIKDKLIYSEVFF